MPTMFHRPNQYLCVQNTDKRVLIITNIFIKPQTIHLTQNERTPAAIRKVNVHCMSYIEHSIVAFSVDKTNMSFLSNVGRSVGKLSLALKGFESMWHLQYAPKAFPKLKLIDNYKQKQLLQVYIDRYNHILFPFIANKKLRTSVIHGDLNDMNMLCNAKGDTKRLIAILDPDCSLPCTVFDIAICVAYFMINHDKPTALRIMYQILLEYHKIFPLTDDEINVVFVAACSRILVSVLVANEKVVLHPENREYLEVHSKPGWAFLEQFADTNPVDITNAIKRKLHTSKL
eukprot:171257_1